MWRVKRYQSTEKYTIVGSFLFITRLIAQLSWTYLLVLLILKTTDLLNQLYFFVPGHLLKILQYQVLG
jgi:hypothetical protein